ncbi:MAG: hypoxanthine phosphoribosyltransferase [Deltaproteobacteria bacterium]|nr:hypoxanthine phosphoribosyltransferase [Deltaproteobacteria bacterium]
MTIQYQCKISQNKIKHRIKEISTQINQDFHGKELTIICVLKGAFIFTADLVRMIKIPVKIEFISVSSYDGMISSGAIRVNKALTADIKGKHVLLVEDIIDSGHTIDYLTHLLESQHPASLRICTLLSKTASHKNKYKIDYIGFEMTNDFAIGYGLDLNGQYRELPFIAQVINSQS